MNVCAWAGVQWEGGNTVILRSFLVCFTGHIFQPHGRMFCPACATRLEASTVVCDKTTGQCRCKNGVDGMTCDVCLDTYYNFTTTGCTGKLKNWWNEQSLRVLRIIETVIFSTSRNKITQRMKCRLSHCRSGMTEKQVVEACKGESKKSYFFYDSLVYLVASVPLNDVCEKGPLDQDVDALVAQA